MSRLLIIDGSQGDRGSEIVRTALSFAAIDVLALGFSERNIEDEFCDEAGCLLPCKAALLELGRRLWDDYQVSAGRDISV